VPPPSVKTKSSLESKKRSRLFDGHAGERTSKKTVESDEGESSGKTERIRGKRLKNLKIYRDL